MLEYISSIGHAIVVFLCYPLDSLMSDRFTVYNTDQLYYFFCQGTQYYTVEPLSIVDILGTAENVLISEVSFLSGVNVHVVLYTTRSS